MSDLQTALRKLIGEEYQRALLSAGSSVLGFVNTLNDDGTLNVLTTLGTQVVATPLHPCVKGQKVIVISSGGTFKCAPTSPNAPPADIIIPPFFTGGAILAAFHEGVTIGVPDSIRFQEVGSNKIFRWLIQTGIADGRWTSLSTGAFSPNGAYFAYAGAMQWNTSTQGPVPFGTKTKLAVVKLGAQFSSAGPIPSFPEGFFLNASEPLQVFIPGFDIIASIFTAQGDNQAYNFSIPSIYVSSDGKKLYWTELLSLANSGTGITNPNQILINLCTLVSGVRTVVSSFISLTSTSLGSPPTLAFQGTSLCGGFGSVQRGAFIIDPFSPILIGLKVAGFPPPPSIVNGGHAILDVFSLNGNIGEVLPPVILELDFGDAIGPIRTDSSQNLALPLFYPHSSSVLDTTTVTNAPTPPNPVVLIVKNQQTGALQQYNVIGTNGLPFGGSPGFTQLVFSDNSALRAFLTLSDFNFNNGTRFVLRKIKSEKNASTVTIQPDLVVITPNPPPTDAIQNYNKFNFRTVSYGTGFIVSNLSTPFLGVR